VPGFLPLLVTWPLAISDSTDDFAILVPATSVAGDFPALVTITRCMNSMMQMADGNGSQWIGQMNSIAAQVVSSGDLPVKRERKRRMREGNKSTEAATHGWVMWQVRMRSLQKAKNLSCYHRVPWNVTTMRQ
jgi:hypothetical protein